MTNEKLPVINSRNFIWFLKKIGFTVVKQKGSHVQLKHADGRIVVVPHHSRTPIRKGLLLDIIKRDG